MNERTKPRRIKSDETLFDIIEYLHVSDNAGVTEIANELDIAKSTVHAHLATLRRRGYVANDGGAYEIGLEFFRHGVHAKNAHSLYPMATEKVAYLAEETDERAWCHVEENGMAYYLCGAEGEHPVHPPVRVGERVYLHTIAGGKAILAYLPETRIREIIDTYGLPASTAYTITDEDELFEELAEIREVGFSFNKQESLRGLHAVAAPVHDHEGTLRGALSISGPANRLKGDVLESKLPELLLGTTNEMEINLTHL